MTDRNRFSGAMVLGAVLALGLASGTIGASALADGKTAVGTQQPTDGPATGAQLKANKPGRQPDIYCTHDADNHNFQACGDAFKAKCKEIGGTLNDPTGNPDYGACIHDDVW